MFAITGKKNDMNISVIPASGKVRGTAKSIVFAAYTHKGNTKC